MEIKGTAEIQTQDGMSEGEKKGSEKEQDGRGK